MSFGQQVTFRTVQGRISTGIYIESHKMTGEYLLELADETRIYIHKNRVIS